MGYLSCETIQNENENQNRKTEQNTRKKNKKLNGTNQVAPREKLYP